MPWSSRTDDYRSVRWLFLRGLGLSHLVAFASLRAQVRGLYGSRGIAPVAELLEQARAEQVRWRELPSVFWLGASDRTLVRSSDAGILLSASLLFNVAPRASLTALWALYLSFVSVGGEFLSYQWDALLLETTLHALLVAPPGLRPRLGRDEPPLPAVLLLRWLVFRLNRQSGLAKISSGDRTWRDRSACEYHFETQPLPTRLAWHVHHLPRRWLHLATRAVLACELYAPFLAFAPRTVRRAGSWLLGTLQAAIAATGNYAFFNLLSGTLALWLLDDSLLPRRLQGRSPGPRRSGRVRQLVTAVASCLAFGISAAQHVLRYGRRKLPKAVKQGLYELQPLASLNVYGLFSVMTTSRPEIVIEGSQDGSTWREYEFRYKPGRLTAPPRWVAPHQPRLDWQMWFAALAPAPPWFVRFLQRLLQGSPDVLELLAKTPFENAPPKYVRAMIYDYRMTSLEARARTGEWWQRDHRQLYFPAVTLQGDALAIVPGQGRPGPSPAPARP